MKVKQTHILKAVIGVSDVYLEVLELQDGSAIVKRENTPLRPITFEEFQDWEHNGVYPR